MRPALLTEFSLLKHSQTFRIWDGAPHDIFPKSRLVMVAESSGRRSMRSSAPLSQPFRLCDRMKWKRGSVSAQLIYYSMTKGWSESCGQRGCSKSETLIGALSWPQNSDPSDPKTNGNYVDGVVFLYICLRALFWLVYAFCVKLYLIVVTGNHSYTMLHSYLLCTPWSLFT